MSFDFGTMFAASGGRGVPSAGGKALKPGSTGNFLSYGRVGAPGSAGPISLPPPTTVASTSKAKTKKKQTENVAQAQKSSTDTLRDITNIGTTANMTPEALSALQGILTGRNVDPLISAKDTAAMGNISSMQNILSGLSPAGAEQRASGRTADLGRQLMEQLLPEIFGGAELAGTGGNVAAQLLGQDAAIRTGEAQSRVIEEARNAEIQSQLNAVSTLGQLTQGTSGANEQLMAALGISKGAIEDKASSTRETAATTTSGDVKSTTTDTGTTSSTGDTTQETVDPLAWAKLQQALALSGSGGGATSGDKALATFIAAGGDPSKLVGGTPFDSGLGQYNRDLMQGIRGYV
jgi:hypothetical protein